MNRIITEHYPLFEHYQAIRHQLMDVLTDEELSFCPGGENQSLGELCREIGEVEHSYIQSFKTFAQNFDYRNEEAGLASSVEKLTGWYAKLDAELKETVSNLTDADLEKPINRGPGFEVKPFVQLEIYKEALLIFYGKVSVYLHAMGKPLPKQMEEWIG